MQKQNESFSDFASDFSLRHSSEDDGAAAPDYSAAAGWYRRAADAGVAGAANAAAVAAALANVNKDVNVNPLGDWTTQQGNPHVTLRALGVEIVKQKADDGDREAQYSLGFRFASEVGEGAGELGMANRSPKAEAGLTLCADTFRSLTTQTQLCTTVYFLA